VSDAGRPLESAMIEGRSAPPALGSLAVQQGTALGVCTLVQVVSGMSSQSLGPLANLVQADLHLSRGELGWLLAACSTGAMIVSLPSGWLVDALGVRRTVAGGILWGGAMLVTASLAGRFLPTLALLLLAGLGIGFLSPATTKAIVSWFPARTRGTAMGFKQTGFAIGGTLSAAVLPSLALALGGWREALLVVGLLGLAVGSAFLVVYHPSAGETVAGARRPAGAWGRVLHDRRIVSLGLLALLYCFNQSSVLGYMSLFLQESLAVPLVVAGGYLAVATFGGAAGRFGWGVLSDRFFAGRRRPVLLIMSCLAICMSLATAAMSRATPPWLVTAVVFLYGLAVIGWSGMFHTTVAESAGRELAGTAMGVGLTLSYVGVIGGPPLFGHLVDLSRSYALAWGVQGVFALAGLAIVISLHEGRRRDGIDGRTEQEEELRQCDC